MKRRREEAADSLELLLDTICNVFGGVVLMAILVVLQTQASVDRLPERASPATTAAVQRLEASIVAAEQELVALEAEAKGLGAEGTQQFETVVQRRDEFLAAVQEAQRRLERANGRASVAESMASEVQRAQDALTDKLAQRGAEVEAARRRMGAVSEAFQKNVRLPARHEQAAPIQRSLLIEGRQIYLLPEACNVELINLALGANRYTPRASAGVEVPEGEATRAAVLATINDCSPRTHFVSFWVSGDDASFETFQRAREAVVGGGYEYSVRGFSRSEGLILRTGRPKAE